MGQFSENSLWAAQGNDTHQIKTEKLNTRKEVWTLLTLPDCLFAGCTELLQYIISMCTYICTSSPRTSSEESPAEDVLPEEIHHLPKTILVHFYNSITILYTAATA